MPQIFHGLNWSIVNTLLTWDDDKHLLVSLMDGVWERFTISAKEGLFLKATP